MGSDQIRQARDSDNHEEVNLSEVNELVNLAQQRIRELGRVQIPERTQGKSRTAVVAGISRDLLYLSHLLDKARLLVLDEYYVAKGFTDHLTFEETS